MNDAYLPDSIRHLYPLIPKEWSWSRLTDICSAKQWQTISQEQMTSSGYPVYGANGIVGYYSEFNHEDSVIAVSCRGACGDIHLTRPKAYVTGNAMCLDDLRIEVDQKYLYYALTYRTLKDAISGSAQPQITRDNLQSVYLPIPQKREQQKIAEILTSVDEVIENTQSQINKLEDLKKATMNEVLTKGIGHTEFKETEIGKVPGDWRVVSVGDALEQGLLNDIQDGNHGSQHPKASDYVTQGVPFVMASDIKDGRIVKDTVRRISRQQYEKLRIGFAKQGDILLTHKATIGEVAFVDNTTPEVMLTPQVTYYRVSDNADLYNKFLYHYLRSNIFQREIRRLSGQSTRDYIGITAQKKLPLIIPPKNTQRRIIEVLDLCELNLGQKRELLGHFRIVKKGLMQDLLTGKVRVTVN